MIAPTPPPPLPFPAPPPPRVALVHDWLTGMRGGEKVIEVLGGLYPEAPLFTLFHFPGSVSPAIESHSIRTSFLQRAPGIRNHYRSYLPFFPAAIEEFDLSGFDLVVSSSHCVAKGVIAPPDAFHVCYCHTPMRYAWDQEHAYFPDRTGIKARLRSLALSALRSWDVSSAARVNHFVANSRFVARRIQTYYGRPAEVVHPPVDVEFFTPAPPAAKSRQGTNRGITAWRSRRSPPTRRSRWRWRPARSWASSCGSSARGRSASGWRGWPARSVHFLGNVDSRGAARPLPRRPPLPAAGGRGLRHRLRRGARLRHAGGRRGPRRHPRRGGGRPARRALPGLGGPPRPLRRD